MTERESLHHNIDETESLFGFLLPLLLEIESNMEALPVEEETQEKTTHETTPTSISSLDEELERYQLSDMPPNRRSATPQEIREQESQRRVNEILNSPQNIDHQRRSKKSGDRVAKRLYPPTPPSARRPLRDLDDEISGVINGTQKIDIDAESDASPNSSDDEYGAKTLMRKVTRHVSEIETRNYAINQDGTEEVTKEEIEENPRKYYVANFRGDHLDYFSCNRARRMHVKLSLDSVISERSTPLKSIAMKSIEKKYKHDAQKAARRFSRLMTSKKLKDSNFIKTYKSPAHFANAVHQISPKHGNPIISTSKDTKVTPVYADHPKEGPYQLHPKYSDSKKPKHRLIGMTTVIVHEANEYRARAKADLEKLRRDGEIGGKSGVERNNQEILFDGAIDSKNIAGYVPLAYPNLSKTYSSKDKKLFGLEESRNWSITRTSPKTLGKTAKDDALYPSNRSLQWKLAEKYATDKNPEGELLWVDRKGKFNRFRTIQKRKHKRTSQRLLYQFEKEAIADGLLPDAHMIERVKNPHCFYHDKELDFLMEAQLPCDTSYISPSITKVPEELRDALSTFIDSYPLKRQLVVAVHSNLHFTAILILINEDGSFSITYFDPVISREQKPLHLLPTPVLTILNDLFPGSSIEETTSEIQHYTPLPDGEFMIDNNHCGPFVLYVMREMTRGNARLALNGSRKIELRIHEEWIPINALSKQQSDDFGKELRTEQAAFLLEEQESETLTLDKTYLLVNHYRKHMNLCWNNGKGHGTREEQDLLGKATRAFDRSSHYLGLPYCMRIIMSPADLKEIDEAIKAVSPEKIKYASGLSSASDNYSLRAGEYFRKAGMAYGQGNKKEARCYEKIAPYYGDSCEFLAKCVAALKYKLIAERESSAETAECWSKLAGLYQSSSDLSIQTAEAYEEKDNDEGDSLDVKVECKKQRIYKLLDKIAELCDGFPLLFEGSDGFS